MRPTLPPILKLHLALGLWCASEDIPCKRSLRQLLPRPFAGLWANYRDDEQYREKMSHLLFCGLLHSKSLRPQRSAAVKSGSALRHHKARGAPTRACAKAHRQRARRVFTRDAKYAHKFACYVGERHTRHSRPELTYEARVRHAWDARLEAGRVRHKFHKFEPSH